MNTYLNISQRFCSNSDAPVCRWSTPKEVAVIVGETVDLKCKVAASPDHVTYKWSYIETGNPEMVWFYIIYLKSECIACYV